MDPHFTAVHWGKGIVSALAGAHPCASAHGQRSAIAAVARLTPRPSVAGVAWLRALRGSQRHVARYRNTRFMPRLTVPGLSLFRGSACQVSAFARDTMLQVAAIPFRYHRGSKIHV